MSVALASVQADADAQNAFLSRTPFACYALIGSAAPGVAFPVHARNRTQTGFGNSTTQITLPGSANYRLQLFDSLRSDGTSNPETLTVDVYDDGVEVASYNVQRMSADPAEWVRLSEPFLYLEDDLTLTGPLEFRNGASSNQTAALALRLWQLPPEDWPLPDPLAMYLRTWLNRVRPGQPYHLIHAFERLPNGDIRTVGSVNASRVPYGTSAPLPGSYQCQVSGELRNLSSSPASLAIDIYDGETLLHNETIAAAGLESVAVAIDETFSLSGGRFEVRNARGDDLQTADLLLKIWRLG